MQRTIDTAVSGLKANALKMDNIANNIANSNTLAYKKSDVEFSDLYYQKIRSATPGTGLKAGMNPAAIGLGVKVASVIVDHSQGVLSSTGRNLDIAIKGEGFFSVTDGQATYYTRNGNLTISPFDSTLCLPDGMKLLGYSVDDSGNADKSAGLTQIKVPVSKNTVAKATSSLKVANNLDRKLAVGETQDIPFFVVDSLGTKYDAKLTVEMTGVGTANWTVTGPAGLANNTGTLTFDTNGKMSGFTGGPVVFNPIGAAPVSFDIDMSEVTYFDKDTDMAVTKQDGLLAGQLQSFSISDGGVIQGNYSNGMIKVLGYIPLANFDNPSGLEQSGSGLYQITDNSGEPMVKLASEMSNSGIVSGYLENSNVDLSEELTNMIKTQRGYQVNSKLITTADEMTQDLLSIKR